MYYKGKRLGCTKRNCGFFLATEDFGWCGKERKELNKMEQNEERRDCFEQVI